MELFQSGSKIKVKMDTPKDKIAAYYVGQIEEEELTEDERFMKDRWIKIWSLLCNYHSPAQAVKKHIKEHKLIGKPISERTAFYDLHNATAIWGSLHKINKQAQLTLYIELQIQTLKMAKKQEDITNMNRAFANLAKFHAQLDEIMADQVEPHTYVIELHEKGKQDPKVIPINKLRKLKREQFYEIIDAVEVEDVDGEKMLELLNPPDHDKQDSA